MNDKIYDLIVLGSGPAGLTAGLYSHRAGLDVLILGGDMPGGKVMMHPRLENYPPFPGGVTGTELMIRWVKQVSDELGVSPNMESAQAVELDGPVKKAVTECGCHLARTIILATGAHPKRLGVPGEIELDSRGVFSCAMCDAPLLRTLKRQRALVVGGGNTAVHTALGLMPHAESVTLVTRGEALRAQPVMIEQFERSKKGEFKLSRSVVSIEGQEWVTGAVLKDPVSGELETVEVEAVFVGVGHVPTTAFLKGQAELDEEGFIKVDERLETSIPGVFAAGDVRVGPMKQIVSAAADGALAAQNAAEYLARMA